MEFAHLVRTRRLEMGLSQKDLAAELGVSPGLIQRCEAGQPFPLDLVPHLALVLDADPAEFCMHALQQQDPLLYASLQGRPDQMEVEGVPPRDLRDRLLVEVRREDAFWIRQMEEADSTTRRCLRELAEQLLKIPELPVM